MTRHACSVFLFFWLMGFMGAHAEEDYLEQELNEEYSKDYLEQELNEEYSNIPDACRSIAVRREEVVGGIFQVFLEPMDTPPLYFCSGVIVRGTRQNLPAGKNAWDPYPAGRTADTSFSYVRSDIKVTRLAWSYTNGFIIEARSYLKVNCFYPLDGESDKREEKGCGAHRDNPTAALDCKDNVELSDATAAASRCRFDLRGGDADVAFAKGVSLAAQASRHTDIPNDLKIETWNAGCDKRLVIRAFFYVNDEGKPFAERDRKQYAQVCGIEVPLVFMNMPDNKDGLITFKVVN
ncbi:hypothetical protein ACX3YG_19510 [Pseudomonas wadenswilerensis]